jgi:hypothetical protein
LPALSLWRESASVDQETVSISITCPDNTQSAEIARRGGAEHGDGHRGREFGAPEQHWRLVEHLDRSRTDANAPSGRVPVVNRQVYLASATSSLATLFGDDPVGPGSGTTLSGYCASGTN